MHLSLYPPPPHQIERWGTSQIAKPNKDNSLHTGDMVKTSVTRINIKHNEKKKLIYMFAVWEHEGDMRQLIILLKWLKELVALASLRRLFDNCAPL